MRLHSVEIILTKFLDFPNFLATHAYLIMPLTPTAPKYQMFAAFCYSGNKTGILINYCLFFTSFHGFLLICINFMLFISSTSFGCYPMLRYSEHGWKVCASQLPFSVTCFPPDSACYFGTFFLNLCISNTKKTDRNTPSG